MYPMMSTDAAFRPVPAVDRIALDLAAERQNQHARQPRHLARIAVAVDTDGHLLMTGARLRAVGAEQPVLPRQVEAEAGVRLVVFD